MRYTEFLGFKTVLEAELARGAFCHGFSSSSAIAASVLVYPAIVIYVNTAPLMHGLSGLLGLSSMVEGGRVSLPVDLDGDEAQESYERSTVSMYLIGVPQVALGFQEWLKTPTLIRYQ